MGEAVVVPLDSVIFVPLDLGDLLPLLALDRFEPFFKRNDEALEMSILFNFSRTLSVSNDNVGLEFMGLG